jgi:hypothetical protein
MASGDDQELGEFELWEDVSTKSTGSAAQVPSPSGSIQAPETGRDNVSPASADLPQGSEVSLRATADGDRRYYVHFGAGATALVPYRFSDGAHHGTVMPEFAVSLAPFGRFMEIGVDLVLGNQADLFLRPNLKFYSFEHEVVSLYLEASAAIYSHPAGTEFGGGGGLGLVFGLMDHLTIELHATAVVMPLSGQAAQSLFDAPAGSTGLGEDVANLTVFPSAGVRLMARF